MCDIFFYLSACPLPLGLSDGRIRDEQLSASSELDDTHAAKQGRLSLISPSKSRLILRSVGQRKKFTTSKKLTSGIWLNAARFSTIYT